MDLLGSWNGYWRLCSTDDAGWAVSSRGEQRDWDDLPMKRARQPLGPEGVARRRSRPVQRALGAKHGQSQSQADVDYRSGRQRPDEEILQRRSDDKGRSRFVAVLVLVVAAVIVTIGGIAATSGDAGSGPTVSISILPFSESTDTTLAQ